MDISLFTARTRWTDPNTIKCGEEGHRGEKYKKEVCCALCVETDNTETSAHSAGSTRCPVYRAALKRVQKKPK